MQLMMYIGNDHIESVSLDKEKISKPGYLGTFKRSLKVKYKDLISQHGSPADFMVINHTPQTANKPSANLYETK
ncbi:MAG TPA: hypothetical protein VIU35_07090 [Chitinophagaceae bacterium]